MKTTKLLFSFSIAIILLAGCSDDNSDEMTTGTELKADFSFTDDDSTFTFTNLSDSGKTYRWDFGDLGFISNEENPVHTYTIGGKLLVSLTVTDENGNEGYIAKPISAPEIIQIDIAIDGDFDDWEHVDVAYENTSGEGAIQKMKVWTVGENVNFYLEGTSDMNMELVQIYLDSDGDPNSGFSSDDWPDSSGAEIMYEGPFENEDNWGEFYQQGEGTDWAFDDTVEGSSAEDLNISAIVNIGDGIKAVEFSINKSILGSLGDTLGIGILELNSGYSTLSVFPDNGKFVEIEL